MRYWKYDDFALDYQLGQQFNFELTILTKAFDAECKHISRLRETFLTQYAAVFNIKRYDMDLRKYL